MNKKLLLPISILGAALLLIFAAYSARGAPDQFIIENADDSRYVSVVGSGELNDLIANVAARYVIEYANQNRWIALALAPAELQTLLGQVAARYVIEYANQNRFVGLTPAPTELQSLLGQVRARYVIEYANQNRFVPLGYPIDLIGDTTDPVLVTQLATVLTGDRLIIQWTVDEYTTGLVEYGVQPGSYTGTAVDAYFRLQHQVLISGLTPGTTIYYRITNTDRSGNVAVSQEYSVELNPVELFFLPITQR
jgi:hypothetical protein